jgi:hypothetical protein
LRVGLDQLMAVWNGREKSLDTLERADIVTIVTGLEVSSAGNSQARGATVSKDVFDRSKPLGKHKIRARCLEHLHLNC